MHVRDYIILLCDHNKFISQLMTGATSFLVIGLHGTISTSLASLALLYAISLAGMFQFTTRLFVEVLAINIMHCCFCV